MQSDEANSAGAQMGPQVDGPKGTASLSPSNNPASNSKKPAQPIPLSESFNAFAQGTPITINNQIIRPPSHGISVAGTTITPGAPPITTSGTPISYGSFLLAVGTSTTSLAVNTQKPIMTTIAGQTVTIGRQNAVEIAGVTMTPGAAAITVSGKVISLGSSILVVGTSTVPLQPQNAEPLITNVAGYRITAAPDAVEVPGTTLHPGNPRVTLDGTLSSLDTSGQLIIDPKTMTLPGASPIIAQSSPSSPHISNPLITTIGSQTITAAPSCVTFAGTTLTPGASGKTINGTLVSLNTAGQLVLGLQTIPLETASGAQLNLGGLIMGGFGADGPFGGMSPSAVVGGGSANGNGSTDNGTSTGVAVFRGKAESLRCGLLRWKMGGVLLMSALLISFFAGVRY